jgi:hypothetical protein
MFVSSRNDALAHLEPAPYGRCQEMKTITATAQTQGQRFNDYDWCIEGEIVMPPVVICRRDRNNPDGGCGCGRAWAGANSHRSTTTAMVRDVPITVPEYVEAIRSSPAAGHIGGNQWSTPVMAPSQKRGRSRRDSTPRSAATS